MGKIKSDIEIARAAKMKPILDVLNGLNVPDKAEVYSPIGRYIAKKGCKRSQKILFKVSI